MASLLASIASHVIFRQIVDSISSTPILKSYSIPRCIPRPLFLTLRLSCSSLFFLLSSLVVVPSIFAFPVTPLTPIPLTSPLLPSALINALLSNFIEVHADVVSNHRSQILISYNIDVIPHQYLPNLYFSLCRANLTFCALVLCRKYNYAPFIGHCGAPEFRIFISLKSDYLGNFLATCLFQAARIYPYVVVD